MRNFLKTTIVIVSFAFTMYSCNNEPEKNDYKARTESISDRVENIDAEQINQIYSDIMRLYCDVVEDIYNKGKETGEYDLERLDEVVKLFYDFQEKINYFTTEDFLNEIDDRYEESIQDRLNKIYPMEVEMGIRPDDYYDYEPKMLPDSSFVLGNDTVKSLHNGKIVLNRDTITEDEFKKMYNIDE